MHAASRVVAMSWVMLALSTVALAQTATPNPEMKKWEPLIGRWVNQEEQRGTPDGSWEKVSSEWDIRWMPGRFFVETPGKMTFPDGRVISWVEVQGYDAGMKTLFDAWFANTGMMGTATAAWEGTTAKGQGTEIAPDGTKSSTRCTWAYPSDFRTVEATCERLTDGKWWVFRKVKGKKQ